jgi:photosystem II stability/assembly factor-like uncharacterized protein
LNENSRAYKVLIHPTNCQTLYVASDNGVLKSTDGGARWTVLKTGLTSTLVSSLAFQPSNPAIIYAGTRKGLFKSTNGGVEWQIFGVIGLPVVSADYHTFISDDHHAFIYHKKTGLTLSRFLTVNRVIPLRVMSMDCSSLYVLTVFSVPI